MKMNNYQVLKILGKGGFSTVLLVRQVNSGKLFAMKIIDKDMIKQRGKVRQIMTERNILLKCRHPYIVQLEEAFQSVNLDDVNNTEIFPAFSLRILSRRRVILSLIA